MPALQEKASSAFQREVTLNIEGLSIHEAWNNQIVLLERIRRITEKGGK
jgi:hypothetical protein